MYIVTKLRKIKKDRYKAGNGKDRGKGAPQVLEQEEVDGIDFQTILFFETEEEALTAAEEIRQKNQHIVVLIFSHHYTVKSQLSPALIVNEVTGEQEIR